GLLPIREQPTGPYGERLKSVVAEENDDRRALMKTLAAEHRVAVSRIEADQAAMWRERAFPGEWIEQQQADGTWQWVPKRTGEAAPGEPGPPAAGGVTPPPPGRRPRLGTALSGPLVSLAWRFAPWGGGPRGATAGRPAPPRSPA